MSADDKRVQDYLGQIRVRVDNWAQGNGYGPDGWPKDAAEHDVIFLLNHIADLEDEAREKNAWEGRYNALLEECELSRPRVYEGDGGDLPAGTVILDKYGDAWQRDAFNSWGCSAFHGQSALDSRWGPYTVVYTPKEES